VTNRGKEQGKISKKYELSLEIKSEYILSLRD
jgi:hypothetical protein